MAGSRGIKQGFPHSLFAGKERGNKGGKARKECPEIQKMERIREERHKREEEVRVVSRRRENGINKVKRREEGWEIEGGEN